MKYIRTLVYVNGPVPEGGNGFYATSPDMQAPRLGSIKLQNAGTYRNPQMSIFCTVCEYTEEVKHETLGERLAYTHSMGHSE